MPTRTWSRLLLGITIAVGLVVAVVVGRFLWSFNTGPDDAERYLVKTNGVSTADCTDAGSDTYDCSFVVVDAKGKTTCSGSGKVQDDITVLYWIGTDPTSKCGLQGAVTRVERPG
jgi:hypothetical protein